MKYLAAILTFFILLMPMPASADTCVDDLINLGTGICITDGPQLPSLLGLGKNPPTQPRNVPPPVNSPAPQPTPQQPTQNPAEPKPSVKKSTPVPGNATSIPTLTPAQQKAAEAKEKAAKEKDGETPCFVLPTPQPPDTIEVGYTTATVAAVGLGVLFAAFLIFYRRK